MCWILHFSPETTGKIGENNKKSYLFSLCIEVSNRCIVKIMENYNFEAPHHHCLSHCIGFMFFHSLFANFSSTISIQSVSLTLATCCISSSIRLYVSMPFTCSPGLSHDHNFFELHSLGFGHQKQQEKA